MSKNCENLPKSENPPKGECRQCWQHAYDKSIHAKLGWREDCGPCVSHMGNRHPEHMIVK